MGYSDNNYWGERSKCNKGIEPSQFPCCNKMADIIPVYEKGSQSARDTIAL